MRTSDIEQFRRQRDENIYNEYVRMLSLGYLPSRIREEISRNFKGMKAPSSVYAAIHRHEKRNNLEPIIKRRKNG